MQDVATLKKKERARNEKKTVVEMGQVHRAHSFEASAAVIKGLSICLIAWSPHKILDRLARVKEQGGRR